MKTWWLVALLAGCTGDHHGSAAVDAHAVHTDPNFCDVWATSGRLAVVKSGVAHTFTRAYAGGVIGGGPVAPIANLEGAPITLLLWFNDVDHIPAPTAQCCDFAGGSCCTLDGLIVNTATSAIGTHPAQFTSPIDASFMAQGSITITDYVAPYSGMPDRIAGSITTTSSGDTVNGMFDTVFCPAMLSALI